MQRLLRLLILFATFTATVGAANEDANLKYFRDLAETRGYSLGRPVAPKLTPDGKTVIYLRGGPRDPVLRLYEFSNSCCGVASEDFYEILRALTDFLCLLHPEEIFHTAEQSCPR